MTPRQKATAELRAISMLQCGGKCWWCGRGWGLQLHHQAKRGAAAKYNEKTVVMLCRRCHHFAEHEPARWKIRVLMKDFEWWQYCVGIRNTVGKKPDPQAEYERLKAIRERIEAEHGDS